MNKTIYFFWGNETISFLRYMTIKSFIYYNPNFKVVLITKQTPTKVNLQDTSFEEKQDTTYFTGKDYMKELMSLDITYEILEDSYPEIANMNIPDASIDDILGWYILGYKGGFKADMDILFTKAIDIEQFKDVDVSLFSYHGNFAIGFLCGNSNILYQELFIHAKSKEIKDYQSIGGTLFRNYILYSGNRYNIKVRYLNNKLVYPFIYNGPWKEQLDIPWKKKARVSEESIGIHWYGGWKTSREFNNKLTKENYKDYDNTISYYIQKVLEI